MNLFKLRIIFIMILTSFFSHGQEIPEPLTPTQRVSYGNHQHTSRDAIYFSEKDSQGNLIILGTTERDFSFTDVKIVSLNENLQENWTDRLSWEGTSYDYPLDLLIDKDDHIWVISKNYVGGSAANFVITRYSPSGEKLWEYKSPELLDTSTLNMRQYHHFFDDEGFLNFSYSQNGQYHPEYSFFRISAQGMVQDQYKLTGPFSRISNYQNFYQGLSLEYDEGIETLYFLKFNKDTVNRVLVELTEEQDSGIRNTLFEDATRSFIDEAGNYIYVGAGKFLDTNDNPHQSTLLFSLTSSGDINFFLDHDPDFTKYLLDAGPGTNNEILVLSNSQSIENTESEPELTLERFSEDGELLFSRKIESITGNLGKIENNQILVRTLSGYIQRYDLELNLLSSSPENSTGTYFQPQDLHIVNDKTLLVGTNISKKFEGSDYNAEQNYYVRKFDNDHLISEFTFNGEGTSNYYNYEMIEEASGDILVSCREFYGPNNMRPFGSRAPFQKKVFRFNSQLEYVDEEIVEEDFDLWQDPGYVFTTDSGEKYRYEVDEERRSINFYLNDDLQWSRALNFGNDNYIEVNYANAVDKEGNFIITSSRYGNYNGQIHKLTPQNDYTHLNTGEHISNIVILSNNWIFTFCNDYSIRIFNTELELINKEQYDENYFYGESYPYLIEKNNKVLLNVRHKSLVMVYDQYGRYKDRFALEGLIHPSVAFFDKNDAFNVYHTIGKGIYTEHAFQWRRITISRYADIINDYLGDNSDLDEDNDGVLDPNDHCPGTPSGTNVNDKGCPLLELSPNNFKLSTKDETCLGKNNGQFVIEVAEEHNYVVDLNGEKHEFNLGLSFEALAPGSYTACIMVREQPQTKKCYEFEIKAGLTLNAQSYISGRSMTINIKNGSAPYNVELNGKYLGTYYDKKFDIPIEDGGRLKISSAYSCEGAIEMLVSSEESIHLVTNPVDQVAELILSKPYQQVPLKLFNSSSQLVLSSVNEPSERNRLFIDVSSLPEGVYYVQIQLEKLHTIKLIKR